MHGSVCEEQEVCRIQLQPNRKGFELPQMISESSGVPSTTYDRVHSRHVLKAAAKETGAAIAEAGCQAD